MERSQPVGTIHIAELGELNQQWSYPVKSWEPKSDDGFWSKIKQRFRLWLRREILQDYLELELDFHASLVRCLNQITKALDTRDFAADDYLQSSIHSLYQELSNRLEGLKSELSVGEAANKQQNYLLSERLAVVENVAKGLERAVVLLTKRSEIKEGQDEGAKEIEVGLDVESISYLLLENRFRGSTEQVSERLKIYPPVFMGAKFPVLEIGVGRGELQQLFRESGVSSYGIDNNQAMVKECVGQGLDVIYGDCLNHLASVEDRSLGGLIAIQVVEHLRPRDLLQLLELTAKKLCVGGCLVLETINTNSMLALTRNYFRDPTHAAPLHPDTLSYFIELSGLKIRELRQLSPYPTETMLQQLPVQEYMTPRWEATIELLNHNVKLLNDLIFGYQDYCVIAEV